MFFRVYTDGTLEFDTQNGYEITDKAYAWCRSHNITNLYEMADLCMVRYGVIGMRDEIAPYIKTLNLTQPEDIFGYRIKALAKKPVVVDASWASIEEATSNLDKLYGKTMDTDTRHLDAVASLYVQSRKPIWHMYSVRSEASAMIRNAKISDEDLDKYAEEARKGIYIKAESGVLYGTVTELLAIGNSLYLGTSIGGLRMYACKDSCEDDGFYFPAAMLALMECENRPIEMREPDAEKLAKSGGRITGGIVRRQISLSKRYYSMKRAPGGKALDREGKVLTVVNVSGFVRNQPYGKGRTQYKRIWIDGFQRGQWVNSGLSYVTVKG